MDDKPNMSFYVPHLKVLKWSEDPAYIPTLITYGLTFSLGLIGNGLVMFTLLGDKKGRNATTSFLVSLAAADMLFLLCIPYKTLIKMHSSWMMGESPCKLFGFIEMLSAVVSVMNLIAVSIERYIVIVHPIQSRSWFTLKKTLKMILLVWLSSIILSFYKVFTWTTVEQSFHSNTTQLRVFSCQDSNYPEPSLRWMQADAWYNFTILLSIPLVAMVYCYTIVIKVLWVSTKQLAKMTRGQSGDKCPLHSMATSSIYTKTSTGNRFSTKAASNGKACKMDSQTKDVVEARKQVIKMLLAIILVYLLCWGPKVIVTLIQRYHEFLNATVGFETKITVDLLPFVQSATNPFIYCFMSKNFQRSIQQACNTLCPCCSCPCSRQRRRAAADFDMESKTANSRYSPIKDRPTCHTVLSDA